MVKIVEIISIKLKFQLVKSSRFFLLRKKINLLICGGLYHFCVYLLYGQ